MVFKKFLLITIGVVLFIAIVGESALSAYCDRVWAHSSFILFIMGIIFLAEPVYGFFKRRNELY